MSYRRFFKLSLFLPPCFSVEVPALVEAASGASIFTGVGSAACAGDGFSTTTVVPAGSLPVVVVVVVVGVPVFFLRFAATPLLVPFVTTLCVALSMGRARDEVVVLEGVSLDCCCLLDRVWQRVALLLIQDLLKNGIVGGRKG